MFPFCCFFFSTPCQCINIKRHKFTSMYIEECHVVKLGGVTLFGKTCCQTDYFVIFMSHSFHVDTMSFTVSKQNKELGFSFSIRAQ